MPRNLAALVALVGIALVYWRIGDVFGVMVVLLVAVVVGHTADALVPGERLGTWWAATAAGLLGTLVGTLLIGSFGPILYGVPMVPSLVGAILVVLLLALFQRGL
ncbi:MAG: hypothetical protein AMXMBFR33_40330 [Candidatus Xenobia bacterium]|jgi:uncharacterized membrane protein YeaQ/YmgE (transglycosylase-associated protein family)